MHSASAGTAPTLGLRERITASKDVLDRAGFAQPQEVKVQAETPLFILPPKDNED